MRALRTRVDGGLERFASVAVRELGDGKVNDAEIVYERLRTVTGNLATLAALVVSSRLLGSMALEIVGVVMLVTGMVVAKLLESDRMAQIQKCRHYVWGLMGVAVPMNLLIHWSTAKQGWGLPNLLGEEVGPYAERIGGSVLTGMLVFGIMFIPLMYLRESFQAWRLLDSRENTMKRTAKASRGRAGRRF